ncbi:MAG: glutamyl-tRNA reductase, partial [Betaproteobacteria bacterium AqS2]|nr:glutamyl-tRNA reductase [Betaproteobacteria bacterium AqS2]
AELFYRKQGRELIKHLFAVACGLDSMILGEPEILGQMKKAYAEARAAGFAGPSMSLLFERAFRVAKTVRSETSIARESVSAAALCAKLARDIFDGLDGCEVLCVGGGAIIETALGHFSGGGIGGVAIANRTGARAEELAARSGAATVPFGELAARLHEFDIVFAATAAPRPVIGRRDLEQACERRRRRPMAVFDLAVPRDVEPAAAELEDVYLYSIDDIGALANVNLDKRRQAMNEAERHIAQAAEELVARLAANGRAPAIETLRERLRGIEEAEAARTLKEIAAGKDPDAAIRELARRLTRKLSHDSVSALGSGRSAPETVEAIRDWYRQGDDG